MGSKDFQRRPRKKPPMREETFLNSKHDIARSLDITLDICPMTFVKTKLELEEMEAGEILEVFLREGEPLSNVTRSCEEENHPVRLREQKDGNIWRILIERGPN